MKLSNKLHCNVKFVNNLGKCGIILVGISIARIVGEIYYKLRY
jgi:hypothetical protein